jgi:hypothetical protein
MSYIVELYVEIRYVKRFHNRARVQCYQSDNMFSGGLPEEPSAKVKHGIPGVYIYASCCISVVNIDERTKVAKTLLNTANG